VALVGIINLALILIVGVYIYTREKRRKKRKNMSGLLFYQFNDPQRVYPTKTSLSHLKEQPNQLNII